MIESKNDRVYIEKQERIRLIIEQEVGFSKIISKIREGFEVKELRSDGTIIIFVEQKKDIEEPN